MHHQPDQIPNQTSQAVKNVWQLFLQHIPAHGAKKVSQCAAICVLCQHQLLALPVMLCNVVLQQAAPQQDIAWMQLF